MTGHTATLHGTASSAKRTPTRNNARSNKKEDDDTSPLISPQPSPESFVLLYVIRSIFYFLPLNKLLGWQD